MKNLKIINTSILEARIAELEEYMKTHLHQALESNERHILKEILQQAQDIPIESKEEIEKIAMAEVGSGYSHYELVKIAFITGYEYKQKSLKTLNYERNTKK